MDKMPGSSASIDCSWFQHKFLITSGPSSHFAFLAGGSSSSLAEAEPVLVAGLLPQLDDDDEALNRCSAMGEVVKIDVKRFGTQCMLLNKKGNITRMWG